MSTRIGDRLAIVYNPLCDEKCPEDCKSPWKTLKFKNFTFANLTKAHDVFALPKPEIITDTENWFIDDSFQITGVPCDRIPPEEDGKVIMNNNFNFFYQHAVHHYYGNNASTRQIKINNFMKTIFACFLWISINV